MGLIDSLNYILVYRNTQENHDKIWGILQGEDGVMYVFWGKWQQALQFKNHGSGPAGINQDGFPVYAPGKRNVGFFNPPLPEPFLIRSKKLGKGYVRAELEDVISQWPEFEDTLWQRLTAFKLTQLAQQCI